MTGAALLRGVMVLLGRVARETEGARRGQLRDGLCRVASVAAPVGVNWPLVSGCDGGGTVARRAIPGLCVVLFVAARACAHRICRCQADRCDVAVGAGQGVVLLMLELNGPAPPILFGHGDRDLNRHPRGALLVLMARGAV